MIYIHNNKNFLDLLVLEKKLIFYDQGQNASQVHHKIILNHIVTQFQKLKLNLSKFRGLIYIPFH